MSATSPTQKLLFPITNIMRNEYVITRLRKQIAMDVTPIIDLIKEHWPRMTSRILRCSESWLYKNVKFDYIGYHRSLHPPTPKTLKQPWHKWIWNTNWLKTMVDDNGRECTRCWQYKLWSEYRRNPQGHRWHSPECKQCTSSYNKAKRIWHDFG